jgi:hypothetical protein
MSVGEAAKALAGKVRSVTVGESSAANMAVAVEASVTRSVPPQSTRFAAIREALSDSNGRLLPQVERAGIKSAIRATEEQGFELLGSIKYRGNQGIDLSFRGVGKNTGRYALAEAKASSGLSSLETDALGIRQGSYEFFRTRLARGIAYGDSSPKLLYKDMYRALRSGQVDLYGSFAGSDRFFMFDPNIYTRSVNFRNAPGAAVEIP